MRRGTRLGVAALSAVLALAGCSSDGSNSASTSDGSGDTGGEGELVQVPGVVTGAGSVAFIPNALRVVTPCDGGLCVWSTSQGKIADRFEGGGIVAHSDLSIYTDRVEDGTAQVVRLDEMSGAEIRSVDAYEVEDVQDGPGQGLRDLAVSPDGKWVAAVGADGVVRRWTADGLDDELTLASEGDAVAVAWSGDASQVAIAASDGPVTIHDSSTGEEVGSLDAPAQGDVEWSQDGAHIATASFALDAEAATTIWDADTLEAAATLDRAGYRLAFVGDDALVLSEKDELDVLRWDWGSDAVRALTGATDAPRAVAVALGGARIYAVSPRDGVMEWTSIDEPATVFEKPAPDGEK